ncbi:MAG TPA: hypothetical protein VEX39_09300 [Thermoleophilaceae bacterium]|nr:hypothetical protein [Thermoleophilaceae bacterium]
MSRRTVSTCVVCAFALAPAALAADPAGAPAPATGGAAAPAPQLAPTPAEAVRQAPAPVAPRPQAVAPAAPAPPAPVATPAAAPPEDLDSAPALQPTSAVIAQSDDDVVEVPVPRERPRSAPAPAPAPAPAAQAAAGLPQTGFDLGMFTAAGLIVLGTGVGLSAVVGPAPRRRRA